MKIEVVIGNIVNQPDVDAIVNSANANLRLGSGVAGAIHTAAGPKLEEYCKPFAPLELGSALITPGFNLPNPWVIHVRAAHFILNPEPERYMLFSVISMLNAARENQLKSVAMPAIGTGVFKQESPLRPWSTSLKIQMLSSWFEFVLLRKSLGFSTSLPLIYSRWSEQNETPLPSLCTCRC